MFICSVTLTKARIALILAIVLMLMLILGVFLSPRTENTFRTNGERKQFLESHGLAPDKTPYRTETLRLPQTLDSFLEEYEALQKSQGLSLLPYCGKTVKKYTYLILSYPNCDKPVYANLLVSGKKLVACDLTCPDFREGWVKPLLPEVPQP